MGKAWSALPAHTPMITTTAGGVADAENCPQSLRNNEESMSLTSESDLHEEKKSGGCTSVQETWSSLYSASVKYRSVMNEGSDEAARLQYIQTPGGFFQHERDVMYIRKCFQYMYEAMTKMPPDGMGKETTCRQRCIVVGRSGVGVSTFMYYVLRCLALKNEGNPILVGGLSWGNADSSSTLSGPPPPLSPGSSITTTASSTSSTLGTSWYLFSDDKVLSLKPDLGNLRKSHSTYTILIDGLAPLEELLGQPGKITYSDTLYIFVNLNSIKHKSLQALRAKYKDILHLSLPPWGRSEFLTYTGEKVMDTPFVTLRDDTDHTTVDFEVDG